MNTPRTPHEVQIPTERINIRWRGEDEDTFNTNANAAIVAKADVLRANGKYPGMEVWYFDVPHRPDTTAADFDAVVVDEDGWITTLPPYSQIGGA